ncbi:MAG: AraC family transcriptional regulator [Lachnospiraceae bacterium]
MEENRQKTEHTYSKTEHSSWEQIKKYSKYEQEKKMGEMIIQGNVEKLRDIFSDYGEQSIGKMNQNPFRQQLYDIIAGVALTTRAAMEGGLHEEEAYGLSDYYIQKADDCTSVKELWNLYGNMIIDFSSRVKTSKSKNQISEVIQVSIDYILKHLHYELTLKEIAVQAGLSETYFSALFKKETGDNVTEFIQKSKIKEAESLLKYSEYSLVKISQYLGFCSQSHFSQTFRKYSGMTPGQYRKLYFKRNW